MPKTKAVLFIGQALQKAIVAHQFILRGAGSDRVHFFPRHCDRLGINGDFFTFPGLCFLIPKNIGNLIRQGAVQNDPLLCFIKSKLPTFRFLERWAEGASSRF